MALSDNVEGTWNFDENTGTNAEDDSGNSYDLSGENTPGWTSSGKISNATDLDSGTTEAWIRATGVLFPAYETAYSFSFWCKPESVSADMFPISKAGDNSINYGRYHIRINNSNGDKFEFLIHEAGGTERRANSTTAATAGNWFHVVGVYDGTTTMKIYINGVYEGTDEVGSFRNTGEGEFCVGRASNSTANSFNGIIDEVVFWNGYALTDGEVALTETAGGDVATLYNSNNGLQYPFAANITVLPSALTLSTTSQSPLFLIQITSGALGLNASLKAPSISIVRNPTPPSTVTEGPGTIGTKILAKRYPNIEGLVAGTTKQTGIPFLVAEQGNS